EEEAAKKKAEEEAAKKKEEQKKKKKKDDDKYTNPCGDWQVDFNGCHNATSGWTDTNTGKSFKAYFPADHGGKILIMTGPRSWYPMYLDSDYGTVNTSAKTCTGKVENWIVDYNEEYDKHYTKYWDCAKGKWIKEYVKVPKEPEPSPDPSPEP